MQLMKGRRHEDNCHYVLVNKMLQKLSIMRLQLRLYLGRYTPACCVSTNPKYAYENINMHGNLLFFSLVQGGSNLIFVPYINSHKIPTS